MFPEIDQIPRASAVTRQAIAARNAWLRRTFGTSETEVSCGRRRNDGTARAFFSPQGSDIARRKAARDMA